MIPKSNYWECSLSWPANHSYFSSVGNQFDLRWAFAVMNATFLKMNWRWRFQSSGTHMARRLYDLFHFKSLELCVITYKFYFNISVWWCSCVARGCPTSVDYILLQLLLALFSPYHMIKVSICTFSFYKSFVEQIWAAVSPKRSLAGANSC